MDEPTQKMLSEMYRITQENNKMLHRINRSQRLSFYWKLFLFIIALGSALGLYYVVQPYVDQFKDIYTQAQSTFTSFIPSQPKASAKK